MGALKLTYYEEGSLEKNHFLKVVSSEKVVSREKKVLDYYPFGSLMPGRWSGTEYRYGMQGQEMDDEIKGHGNSINYKYRMDDPRLGRFFSVDPLAKKFPHMTPYQFAGNKPIWSREIEGLESEVDANEAEKKGSGFDFGALVRSSWESMFGFADDGDITSVTESNLELGKRLDQKNKKGAKDVQQVAGAIYKGITLFDPFGASNSSRLFLASQSQGGVSDYYSGVNNYLGTDYGPYSDGFWGTLGFLSAGAGGGGGGSTSNQISTVYHSTSTPGAAANILSGINPAFFNSASRFGRGFYLGSSQSTTASELAYHGSTVLNTIRYDMVGARMLDARGPIMGLGVQYTPRFLSFTAKTLRFDGIIFNSLRSNGTNSVLFRNFNTLKNGTIVK